MVPARKIVLLGSTGSIGTQTLDVAARLGPERVSVIGLAARGGNVALLTRQARETGARWAAVADPERGPELECALAGTSIAALAGDAALVRLASLPEADTVVIAVAGAAGLAATLAAARAGKRIAIATKEALVAAGELVTRTARAGGATLLPIDSEHSAIFQCVRGYAREDIARIFLTASGGPFRTWTAEEITRARPADALNHPTWRMGGKITVDSATLMNKGLEILEASVLFGVPAERVAVVIHPQSVIHSFVEMRDGALLAQMGLPDMRLPIQIALTYPEKVDTDLPRLDPCTLSALTFETPDAERFPALNLARRAAETGGTAPAVLNGANEAAVHAFLDERIPFPRICAYVGEALARHAPVPADTLEDVLAADAEARQTVARLISEGN